MEQKPVLSNNFYRGLVFALLIVTPFWVALFTFLLLPFRTALSWTLIVLGLCLIGIHLMLKYTRRT